MINHPFGEPQDPSSKDEKGEYNQAGRKIGNHLLENISIDNAFHAFPAEPIQTLGGPNLHSVQVLKQKSTLSNAGPCEKVD